MPRFNTSLYNIAAAPLLGGVALAALLFVLALFGADFHLGPLYADVAEAIIEHAPYGPVSRISAYLFGYAWLPFAGIVLSVATLASIGLLHLAFNVGFVRVHHQPRSRRVTCIT